MRALIEKRPSTGTVLSLVALFVALGGTSYAAATIGGNQVKNNSLSGADVKNRSLTGKDVKNNSLGGSQVNESKLGQVGSAAKASQADNATQAQKAATADTVADNAITGGKVADRSLGAVDVAIANGTRTVDLPSIGANTCNYSLQDTNVDLTGATVVVSAPDSGPFSLGGVSIHVAKSNIEDSFRLVACNLTAGAIDPDAGQFDFVAIR
jgi:hypothetical protein